MERVHSTLTNPVFGSLATFTYVGVTYVNWFPSDICTLLKTAMLPAFTTVIGKWDEAKLKLLQSFVK